MPLPIESATEKTSIKEIRTLIGKSIAQCIKEGKDQKQCAAMAYDMARRATGRDIGKEA